MKFLDATNLLVLTLTRSSLRAGGGLLLFSSCTVYSTVQQQNRQREAADHLNSSKVKTLWNSLYQQLGFQCKSYWTREEYLPNAIFKVYDVYERSEIVGESWTMSEMEVIHEAGRDASRSEASRAHPALEDVARWGDHWRGGERHRLWRHLRILEYEEHMFFHPQSIKDTFQRRPLQQYQ